MLAWLQVVTAGEQITHTSNQPEIEPRKKKQQFIHLIKNISGPYKKPQTNTIFIVPKIHYVRYVAEYVKQNLILGWQTKYATKHQEIPQTCYDKIHAKILPYTTHTSLGVHTNTPATHTAFDDRKV